MWDEYERGLVDAYKDYLADLHTCGRPLSESLRWKHRPDPAFGMHTRECVACEMAERFRAKRAKEDEELRKDGINPDTWRLDTIVNRAEHEQIMREQREG